MSDSLERRLDRLVETYSAQGCSTCRQTSTRLVMLYDDHVDANRPEFCAGCGKAAEQTLIINLRTDDDDEGGMA